MWIAGPVIVDLKSEKLMDRFDRLHIGRCDANSSTTLHRFEDISNAGSFGLHHWDSGWHGVMNEHRKREIPVREHLSDMR